MPVDPVWIARANAAMPWNGTAVGPANEPEIRRLIAEWDPQFYADLLRSGMEPLPALAVPAPSGGPSITAAAGGSDPSAAADAERRLAGMVAAAGAVDPVVLSGLYSRALEMVALEHARHGRVDSARTLMQQSVHAARFDLTEALVHRSGSGFGASLSDKKLAKLRAANEATVLQQQMHRSYWTLMGRLPDGSSPTLTPRPNAEQRLAALDCMMWFASHWKPLGVPMAEPQQLVAIDVVSEAIRVGGPEAAGRALELFAPRSPATPALGAVLDGDQMAFLGYGAAFEALEGYSRTREAMGLAPDPAFTIKQMQVFDAFERMLPPDVTNRSATTFVMRLAALDQDSPIAIGIENVTASSLDRLEQYLCDGATTFGIDPHAGAALATELQGLAPSKRAVAGVVATVIDASLQSAALASETIDECNLGDIDSIDISMRLGQQHYQTALYLRNLAYELGRDLSPESKAVLADAVAVQYTLATETFAVIQLPRAQKAANAIAQEAAQYQSQDLNVTR